MIEWITKYWYEVTGIAGVLIYFGAKIYIYRAPDSPTTLFLRRCGYAWIATIVFNAGAAISLIIASIFYPNLNSIIDLFFFPYGLALFPIMVWLAPSMQKRFPARRNWFSPKSPIY